MANFMFCSYIVFTPYSKDTPVTVFDWDKRLARNTGKLPRTTLYLRLI